MGQLRCHGEVMWLNQKDELLGRAWKKGQGPNVLCFGKATEWLQLEAATQVLLLWVRSPIPVTYASSIALSRGFMFAAFRLYCISLSQSYLSGKALITNVFYKNSYHLVFNSCLILLQKEKKGRRRTSKVNDAWDHTSSRQPR